MQEKTPEQRLQEKIEEYRTHPDRLRKPRRWVKMDCNGCLHGSINYMYDLEQQAIFLKLIMMAETHGPIPGLISDNDLRPLPFEHISRELHAPHEIFLKVLEIGSKDGQIYENSHGLFLVNFDQYQFTEYDRQKPYREKKKVEVDPDKFIKGKYGHMVKR